MQDRNELKPAIPKEWREYIVGKLDACRKEVECAMSVLDGHKEISEVKAALEWLARADKILLPLRDEIALQESLKHPLPGSGLQS